MENYNTTMFAKGGACSFATEISASQTLPDWLRQTPDQAVSEVLGGQKSARLNITRR